MLKHTQKWMAAICAFLSGNLEGGKKKQNHANYVCLPNKADMFWKIRSSSGVMAGQFSKVTNL